MTEEEAKKKWCPLVRSIGWSENAVANRDHRGGWTDSETCVASGCMMWRWEKVENPNWSPPQGNPLNGPLLFIDSTTNGYCGLAK